MKMNSRGIVVVAGSRVEAENQYRSVAKGHNVMALASEQDNFVVLSTADKDGMTLLNPLTGTLELEAKASVLDQMDYASEASTEDRETNYMVCLSGCQSHIIYDDSTLVKFCPACASDIQDITEEEIVAAAAAEAVDAEEALAASCTDDSDDADVSDESDESDVSDESDADESDDLEATAGTLDPQGVVATGRTREEAQATFVGIATGEIDAITMSDDENSYAVAASTSNMGSPFTSAEFTQSDVPFEAQAANVGDEIEAHYYVCSASEDCGAHVISQSDDVVFCPECLAGVVDPVASENVDVDEALDALATSDVSDEDLDATASADDSDDSDEDMSAEAAAAEDDGSDDSDLEANAADSDSAEDEFEVIAGADASDDDESDESDLDVSADDSDDSDSALSVANEIDLTQVTVEMAAFAGTDDELLLEHLDVAYAGTIDNESSWYAYYKGMPVARATKATATAATNIFDKELFGQAVVATASENGVVPALKSMGFVMLTATASIEDHVQCSIKEQVAVNQLELQAAYERMASDLSSRFQAALATASVGINRNFFSEYSNPVREALISAMAAAGIRTPHVLVNNAFEKHSDVYNSNLVAKASEIMAMDTVVQDQLTDAVAGANYSYAGTEGVQPIGTPVAAVKPMEAVAAAQPAAIEATASSDKSFDQLLTTALKFGK